MDTTLFRNLATNWKTASSGAGAIVAGIVHLAFCISAGNLTEKDVALTVMSILGGFVGLAAADASAAAKAHADSTDAISTLNNKVEQTTAVVRVTADTVASGGDTTFLKKVAATLPVADPSMLTKPEDTKPA